MHSRNAYNGWMLLHTLQEQTLIATVTDAESVLFVRADSMDLVKEVSRAGLK